jgi:hypothetical protein
MELELIKNSILDIRGKRVILDYELSNLYEVETSIEASCPEEHRPFS